MSPEELRQKELKELAIAERESYPTLGNLIRRIDKILKTLPESLYPLYAKTFAGTLIEKVIFSGESFQKAAVKAAVKFLKD